MTGACDDCVRRGALIAALSPRMAGMLGPGTVRTAALFSLTDGELLDALAGPARPRLERMLASFRPADARGAIAAADCEVFCRHSSVYPERLTNLPDPPNPLYVRGGADRLQALVDEPTVAIVGARTASAYGRTVARHLGRGLAAAGVTVVSGMALGIDAASHHGALDGGGGPVAVLACGPDVIYPARHARLYERIVETGVVLSELAPGTEARRWGFPARNRIMAALAQVVVVVEAQESSGSLITSTFATDLGREVAAVPGQVTARLSEGSNRLLRDGAAFIRNAEDVLELLFGTGYKRPPAAALSLEPQLRLVLDAVEVRDGLHLARERAGLSAGGLRAALGRLEALGLVRRDGVGGYERCIQEATAS